MDKKSILLIVVLLILVVLLIGTCSGGSGSSYTSGDTRVCRVCNKTFSDSGNVKSIRRTNMCSRCYSNYSAMQGALNNIK